VHYEPNQICVASGAKHSLFITLMCLLNPGDEVVLPGPFWVSYYEMINMAGGVPVIINAAAEDNFKIKPDALERCISKKTKAIILNNPSNPTGMLYSGDELRAICDVCVKNDLYIICDEIYYCLVYDNKKFVSVPSLSEDIKAHTILVNGVSKAYAMTGWRIGYTACGAELAKVMSNYLGHSTSAPSTISQCAAVEALLGQQESVSAMRAEFEKRRDYMVDRMSKIKNIKVIKPDGAFYIMMDVGYFVGKTVRGHKIMDSADFAKAFVKEEMVAVVPGYSFGAEYYVRWSYATDMESIKKAMDRLERFAADAE
jgi:aspartate aminotransferase